MKNKLIKFCIRFINFNHDETKKEVFNYHIEFLNFYENLKMDQLIID